MKFKAWDEDFGQWVQDTLGYEYFVNQNGLLYFIDTDDGKIRRYPNKNKVIWYTGLRDKNGVEIYESDRVAFTEGSKRKEAVIVWREREALFAIKDGDGWGSMALQNLDDIEVVGNIYES
ncbi:MAG: YopX family protein [Acidobacteria bacterium]|nr:YopX family protein [Acidobacteriota bacterium]